MKSAGKASISQGNNPSQKKGAPERRKKYRKLNEKSIVSLRLIGSEKKTEDTFGCEVSKMFGAASVEASLY